MWRQCGRASQIQPALPACLVKGRLVMVALYVVCFCLYVECWGWQLSLWRIFASTNNTPPQKKYVDKTQFLPPLSTKFYQIKMKKINSSFYLYSFFIVIAWEKTLSTVDFPPYLKMVQVYGWEESKCSLLHSLTRFDKYVGKRQRPGFLDGKG